jgi:EF-P beta-lysylation protein EpmB
MSIFVNQIIPKNMTSVESNWQKELSMSFTTLESLLQYLEIDTKIATQHNDARKLFPMRVPRHFASLMAKGNFNDPLLKQVLPLRAEFADVPGFVSDPLNEQSSSTKGVLHKYKNRALLLVKTGCAVNCRYCFRREFPYKENAMNKSQWLASLKYIEDDSNIDEVIFSGGDPLMATNEHLAWLSEQISHIEHVKTLRIHTRLPVVIPSRIDSSFLGWLRDTPLNKVIVFHINHANELSTELKENIALLRSMGVTLLNQSVLLKGINDSVVTQVELNRKLFDFGVLPYYLHLVDKVKGVSHFDVDETEAVKIMSGMIKRLPGYLVPKLVREIGGQPSKTPINLNLQP